MLKDETLLLNRIDSNICTIFGNNLMFSFIGGSCARNQDRPDSDIDIFVVLHNSNRSQELNYLDYLVGIHTKLNKHYDHCGFLMDEKTLNGLMYIAEDFREAFPYISNTSCCLSDCILSKYQYAKIIMQVLSSEKILLHDHVVLSSYIERAKRFTDRDFGVYEKSQPHKFLSSTSPICILKQRYDKMIEKGDLADTPVGVELNRYYQPDYALKHNYHEPIQKNWQCPLVIFKSNSAIKHIIEQQCIGIKTRGI